VTEAVGAVGAVATGVDLRTSGLGVTVLRDGPVKCLGTAGDVPAAKAGVVVGVAAVVAVAVAALGTTALAVPRSCASLADIRMSSESILPANLQSIWISPSKIYKLPTSWRYRVVISLSYKSSNRSEAGIWASSASR
jgi:hypothetical protein